MKILALDPGGTTGWAFYDQIQLNRFRPERLEMGQMGPEDHYDELYQLMMEYHAGPEPHRRLHVVCESFEYRKGLRDNVVLVSLEYIGVVKLFDKWHSSELAMQTAAEGKAFWNDNKLKRLGLEPTYALRHQHDAARHMLTFMCKDPLLMKGLMTSIKQD